MPSFNVMPFFLGTLIVVGILALMILPFVIGGYFARKLRMPDHGWKMGVILWSLAVGVVVIVFSDGPKLGIDLSGGLILVYEVDQDKKDPDKPVDMDKMIAAIKMRVDPSSIKEVTIRPYGVEQIEIIIPEVEADEAQRIEEMISNVGSLEFRILADQRNNSALIERAKTEDSRILKDDEGNELARWVEVEPGEEGSFESYKARGEMAWRMKKKRRGGQVVEVMEVLVLKDEFDVTGDYLERSEPSVDQSGKPCVNFMFGSAGGKLFGGLTSNNLPDTVQPDLTRKLGIILNDKLYSAPSIRSTITTRGEITGSFTREEVEDLVGVLNAGSLPTALSEEPISRLETGPTLGQDTIDKGTLAMGASMLLVLLFMLFYYRFSGIVACAALLTNLLLILAVMITIKAAFTLPGLAGLVLTVGMAVDANVLVFERIREELARGAALRMAIRNGFSRATTTIVDANLTTLITATILYVIGTDQIKGFAVVLWLGVVLSMYTAIFCSRVVFDIAEKRRWISKLSMVQAFRGTQIDFLGKRYLAGTVSVTVIVVGLVGVVLRGAGLLDIDFTGGVSIQALFKPDRPQPTGVVRDSLSETLADLAVSDVRIGDEPEGVRFMINTSNSDIQEVKKDIHDVFGDKLAANSMHLVKPPEKIEPATPKAGKTASEKPSGPDATDQSRSDLPDDSVLAMADAPAEGPSEETTGGQEPGEPPATPAEATSAAPGEEPAGEPAQPVEASDQEPAEPDQDAAPDPFVGGTRAQLKFDKPVRYDSLMEMFVNEFGSDATLPLLELSSPEPGYEEGSSQRYSTWDVKIKLPPTEAKERLESIQKRLAQTPFFPSSNTIGGKVAGSTRTLAITALLASLLCIVGYLWIRFQRVMFGLAAVVALVHDVLVTLGVIALSYYAAPYLGTLLMIDPFKIGLPVLAAFLTIIGYSLNDTIVVFDRIREVRGKAPRLTSEMINTSINQTLSRTLLTSGTTLIVVMILYIFGGQGIHGFAFALVVGVVVGTYSSIYVASPVLLWMSRPSAAKQSS